MTHKETIERNIGLTFDLLRKIAKNPESLDSIPNGKVIEFVEKDFGKKGKNDSIKPSLYLKVKSRFELVAEPKATYRKKRK